jgi:signal transduction histidine kinase
VNYLEWCSNVEPALHFFDKLPLIMIYYSSCILLNSAIQIDTSWLYLGFFDFRVLWKWYTFITNYFKFWILIFSQASNVQQNTFVWFWVAARRHSSQQPCDPEGKQPMLYYAVWLAVFRCGIICFHVPSCSQNTHLCLLYLCILFFIFSIVFNKFQKIFNTLL